MLELQTVETNTWLNSCKKRAGNIWIVFFACLLIPFVPINEQAFWIGSVLLLAASGLHLYIDTFAERAFTPLHIWIQKPNFFADAATLFAIGYMCNLPFITLGAIWIAYLIHHHLLRGWTQNPNLKNSFAELSYQHLVPRNLPQLPSPSLIQQFKPYFSRSQKLTSEQVVMPALAVLWFGCMLLRIEFQASSMAICIALVSFSSAALIKWIRV